MGDVDDLFACFDEEPEEQQTAVPVVMDVEVKSEEITEIEDDTDISGTASKRHIDDSDEDAPSKKQRVESLLDDINLETIDAQIKIHVLKSPDACLHEVAVHPNQEYVPLKPSTSEPAKEYPFILDPFQKEAILCIENDQSVLVSAHTSAGKTVVAEYAVARALSMKQRVIYTTPIKALSNQKYREFHEEFQDVGLVTGDITINPSASCLIMTTEILRNMLYRGSEIMREVGWVVFDEIHYMRDKERGVVWEETLILLPDNVHYVFLSATIPNARQFAEWVCHIHKQPCHVVYTDYRPTPLQHYLFPAGGDGIHLVVDEKGNFKEDNFNAAMNVLVKAGEAAKGDEKGRGGGIKATNRKTGESNIFKIVKMIMERSLAPVIIFSFSKKECETNAQQMAKLDFNSAEEKKLVDEVFSNAMDVLNDDDKKLPQVQKLLPLLRRGIGIHHGGLLPILKETIEILFGEGLLKALFATETFAMGLNMPARTVVFTSSQKFDGKNFRTLASGEYIQMSGRAGRRGLDDKGIVILMVDEKVSPATGREIVQGKPNAINSAFHLTYNMVLNLLRVEEINPEYMIERSFFQFQNQSNIPDLYKKVQKKLEDLQNFHIKDEASIKSYHHIREQLDSLSARYQKFYTHFQYLKPFLQPGRLIKVKSEEYEYEWGMILDFKTEKLDNTKNPLKTDTKLIVEVLLHLDDSSDNTKSLLPCPPGKTGRFEAVPIDRTMISKLSSLRIHYPNDLRSSDVRRGVLNDIFNIKKKFPTGIPLLNPVQDMKIKDKEFLNILELLEKFEKRLYAHPLTDSPELNELYGKYMEKLQMEADLLQAKKSLKDAKSLLQMDDLKHRKRVLRRLGYCTNADVIEFKGRVACELSSGDELLITEMIFNGTFNDLPAAQCAALLSCFVCDDRAAEQTIDADLQAPLKQMQDFARRIAKVSKECKMELDEDEYVEKFKTTLMDVVLKWCKGSSFLQICQITDVFEGNIIRCMRRLEELMRQMVQASKTIGNTDLENKFSEGIRLLKRDIVFAASLYL
ncbi:exosome RNA helicase MTR4 [Chironomus tepperi]|uniref:exosome RNA helicase MTR4 n=1 Tax=Chironomus tepperi TaxID=113505 RepID=UPI00391F3B0F